MSTNYGEIRKACEAAGVSYGGYSMWKNRHSTGSNSVSDYVSSIKRRPKPTYFHGKLYSTCSAACKAAGIAQSAYSNAITRRGRNLSLDEYMERHKFRKSLQPENNTPKRV